MTTRPARARASSGGAEGAAAIAGTIETAKPTIITHASTELAPIIRLDRDEQSVATAQETAAPRPPAMAIIRRSLTASGRRAGHFVRRVPAARTASRAWRTDNEHGPDGRQLVSQSRIPDGDARIGTRSPVLDRFTRFGVPIHVGSGTAGPGHDSRG